MSRRISYQPNAPGQPISLAPAPETDLLQSRTVTLTSPQILALKDTAVLLLPAPGPNKTIVPLYIVLSMHTGAIAYALPPTNELDFSYDMGLPGLWKLDGVNAVGILDQLVPTVRLEMVYLNINDTRDQFVNFPIVVKMSFSEANPTLGDGTLEITVFYFHAPL